MHTAARCTATGWAGIRLLLPLKEGSQLGAGSWEGKGPQGSGWQSTGTPLLRHALCDALLPREVGLGGFHPQQAPELTEPGPLLSSRVQRQSWSGGGAEEGANASELDWLEAQNLSF